VSDSDYLDVSNNLYAEAHRGDQQGGEKASAPTIANTPPGDVTSWSVAPEEEWFDTPTSRRPVVGFSLLQLAWTRTLLGSRDSEQGSNTAAQAAVKGLWDDPLVIRYLNIGFRRLERSLPGIAHFVSHHRPDVLLLGTLGVARSKVGRLTLMLVFYLGDEWVMITDISAPKKNHLSPEIAAVIHCSLA
jgi:hypothetical protein